MAFYEILVQASQTLFVEADSLEEALDVGCRDYSIYDFEFDEGRCIEKLEDHPEYTDIKIIYK